MSITELLGHDDIEIATAGTGGEALRRAAASARRLRVLRPAVAGYTGLRSARSRLAAIRNCPDVPVVVFTGRELSAEEDAQLHTMARSIVVKGLESPPSDCSMKPRCSSTASFTDLPLEKQGMLDRPPALTRNLIGPHGASWSTTTAPTFCSEQRTRTARDAGIDRYNRKMRRSRWSSRTPDIAPSC